MRITKRQLRRVIKESVRRVLQEQASGNVTYTTHPDFTYTDDIAPIVAKVSNGVVSMRGSSVTINASTPEEALEWGAAVEGFIAEYSGMDSFGDEDAYDFAKKHIPELADWNIIETQGIGVGADQKVDQMLSASGLKRRSSYNGR